MKKINVFDLPLVDNVCDQMLREVMRNDRFSVAHVTMNPGDEALLHAHRRTSEVYVVTRGSGVMTSNSKMRVHSGSAFKIKPNEVHAMSHIGMTSLEHLVLAFPPFNPEDVYPAKDYRPYGETGNFFMTAPQECFDGAKIIQYEFPGLELSVAFGWTANDPDQRKKPHYHKETTEHIYIAEGSGSIEINGVASAIKAGDWITVEPGERHALRNDNRQHMVVVCICSPQFHMTDVFWD